MSDGTESATRDERAQGGTSERRGLRAGSIELLREALEQYRSYNAKFIEKWFPTIAQRGSVEYGDIERLSPDQADALRYMLAQSYRYLRRQDGLSRGRSQSQLLADDAAEDEPSQHLVKARQYAEALGDLCELFGMPNPLEG